MKVEDIKYDDNDKTIESIRLYKQQMESQNLTQEQQDLLISKLIFEIVDKLHKTLKKETNELDKLVAMHTLLLAVGKINDEEREEFLKIKRYKSNTIEFFALKSKDLIQKLEEFRDGQFKE